MGYVSALALGALAGAGGVEDAGFTLEAAIAEHLRHNVFPPVPADSLEAVVSVALEAVEACADGEPHRAVALPDGVRFRGCSGEYPAYPIVESLRLGGIVDGLLSSRLGDDWEE